MIPVGNQVLVKPYPSPEISEAGLYIPENAREVNDRCLIVKVGNGTPKKKMHLKEGQTAHRVHLWGEQILIDGELHFLMDQSAIISIE